MTSPALNMVAMLVGLGAVACYFAVMALPERMRPAAMALPISVAGCVMAALGYGEPAIAMISGTAIWSVLLCGGLVLITGRRGDGPMTDVWSVMLLPTGLVLMFLGMRGSLDGLAVVLLLTLGFAAYVSNDGTTNQDGHDHLNLVDQVRDRRVGLGQMAISAACAALLAAVSGVLWTITLGKMSAASAWFNPDLTAMVLLPAAVGFAMVGVSVQLGAHSYQAGWRAVSQTGIVLLTVSLPLVILSGAVLGGEVRFHIFNVISQANILGDLNLGGDVIASTQPSARTTPAVTSVWPKYPIVSWRMDSAVLVVFGLVLLGQRVGLARASRLGGAVMVVCYVVYLFACLAYGRG